MSKVSAWTALAAALLSPAVLFAATATPVKKPDIRERFAAQGAEAVGSTSAEFAAHIRREIDKWGKVVRAAKLTVN